MKPYRTMIHLPNMLLIGAAERHVGKTELACAFIARHRLEREIVGIKVTTESDRGAAGEPYEISDEAAAPPGKDTGRLLAAGAARVFHLTARRERLGQGITELLKIVGQGSLLICESNSLRHEVVPGVFLMVRRKDSGNCKPSAAEVMKFADRVVLFDGRKQDIDPDRIQIPDGRWIFPIEANAVILAGGKSSRMGADKSLLSLAGRPLIQHLHAQLHGTFGRILVSVGSENRFPFLDGALPVFDAAPGLGPLGGILAALEASDRDLNFIVACDIPEVPLFLVRRLVAGAADCDCVIPVSAAGHPEPLFGIYRKSLIGPIREALASGRRAVKDLFERVRVHYLPLDQATALRNLNTRDDFQNFLQEQRHA
ncbi:MAG: molybdenum cofactor guanylyltransferase [Deltaproteobacteria bacterium]|nr:molybdenum cofactor guanylyltransferase [Deltaproteobacteria bacterium]